MAFVDKGLIAAFVLLLLYAAYGDIRSRLIPNWISVLIALLYGGHLWVSPVAVDGISGLTTGVAVFIVGAALFGLNLLGGGDVKLMAATALWSGSGLLVPVLFVTAIAGGVVGVLMLLRQRFAPAVGQALLPEVPVGDGETEDEHAQSLPYGVAIACGGIYLALKLLGV